MVLGALGLLTTLLLLVGGIDAVSLADTALDEDEAAGAVVGVVVIGLLALAWTVLMIWGSALALTGRSRVLLLVGGSIAIACTALFFVAALVDVDETGALVLLALALLLASVAIVVLLCLRSAAYFYRAHRHLRSLTRR